MHRVRKSNERKSGRILGHFLATLQSWSSLKVQLFFFKAKAPSVAGPTYTRVQGPEGPRRAYVNDKVIYFSFMPQLSSDDIGQVESLANNNRELSKNDFIFHIKVLSIDFFHFDILNLLKSKCF